MFPMRFRAIPLVAVLLAASLFSAPEFSLLGTAAADDWTYWRGPSMNGTSTATGLPDSWDPKGGEGSNVLWKRDDLGTRSSPVVMNGRVYFLARHNAETPKEQEKVVCLDAETGETLWENTFNIFLSDVPDTRVAWSNVVADPESGNVYALGVCGLFQCLDAATGETLWKHSMSEEYGLLSTYGGRTNMPIVVGDTVIISAVIIGWGEMAKPAHRFLGFDKLDGTLRWFNGTRLLPDDTTYSAPVLTAFEGKPAIVFGSGDGAIHAFEPQTGRSIWTYDISTRGINTTPLVDHSTGLVYSGHSEENIGSTEMGALFAVNGQSEGAISQTVWTNEGMTVGRAAPLMIGDYLYAADDKAKMRVIDPKTGEELDVVRMGTMQRMSPVYADGKIYTGEANGRIYILKPDGDKLETIFRGRLPRGEEVNGSPAIAMGRIFWPTSGGMYCLGTGEGQAALGETDLPEITLSAPDSAPAQVQVVPAETLVEPGTEVDYTVRLFNDKGQFIREAGLEEVTFDVQSTYQSSVTGGDVRAPTFDGSTLKTANGGFSTADVTVTLKEGDLKGYARVRMEPPLDWTFGFDDQLVPNPWVGAAYRTVSLEGDLLDTLQKDDPTGADLYIYLASSLINSGAPALTYDDSTPAQKWTDLLRFFGLSFGADRPQTVDAAKTVFESSLQRLVKEGVLGGYEWSTWKRSDSSPEQPRLKIMKGSRRASGNGVLMKIRTIPKGTRSQSWMGSPDLSDYTIQADVKAFARDGKLPDMGLIAQRYTLDLMGAKQQLQIRTWTPQEYLQANVSVDWQPDTWYTMKFKAANEGDVAVLRGKVWKRDEEEPSDWTVTIEDPLPNRNGSPGFFGNAKDSEILYDNIRVTANK